MDRVSRTDLLANDIDDSAPVVETRAAELDGRTAARICGRGVPATPGPIGG